MALIALVAVLALCAPVHCTYSIAATDSATRQVGGSTTSCVGSLDVAIVYASSPGNGVVHAQASVDSLYRGRNTAATRLSQGTAPSAIITEITNTAFDANAATRQYGVVDLRGRAAGYTGARATDFKNDIQGTFGTFTYSAQGNIITSNRNLLQTVSGFTSGGCDLAERLMRGLERGADNGEGDTRCTRLSPPIPADSAFIQVDLPDRPAGSYLRLSVTGTRPNSAMPRLRERFNLWRQSNPCGKIMPFNATEWAERQLTFNDTETVNVWASGRTNLEV